MLVGYLLLGTGVLRGVEARWAQILDHEGFSALRSTVVPAFPGPLRWVGVAETPQGIVRSRFWAWRVTASTATWFPEETLEPNTPEVEGHWAVQAFLEVARFPWRTAVADGKVWIIEYQDLAFVDHPFGGPMVLRLRLDPSGAVKALEFDHRL